MKKFNFKLEKILRLRKFTEEECKHQLSLANAILSEIENNIKQMAVKRHNAAKNRFTDPMQIMSWELYILRLDQETQKLEEDAVKAQLVVEEKRAAYLAALRKLKAIEKLKEKRKEEYKKEVIYNDMLNNDYLAAARSKT